MLGAVAAMTASEPSRDALLANVCRIAMEEGGFKVAWVCMLDRLTMQYSVVAFRGADREFVEEQMRATVGEGASHPVPARLPMLAATGAMFPAMEVDALEFGAQTLALFSLTVEGQQAGWLALYAAAPSAFDASEVQLLGQLARDVGVALELIEKSARLQYVARFDTLTGLANGTLFNNRLRSVLATPQARARGLALVVMDIERFGNVNETWGRDVGDALLQRVAARLSRHVPESKALARIGADRFAIVFVDDVSREAVATRLERLHGAVFDEPFVLATGKASLAARFGVAVFPQDGDDLELLFRNAETAVKNVKSSDDRVCFYDAGMAALRAETKTLESQVRRALELDELVLHYEPKCDLVTRKIVGVEAQMFWNSPELGLLSPARSMALLENTGLVTQVGMWALERAARDHGNWARAGHRPPRIAVNVSPLQLRQRGFVDRVALAIREDVTPPGIDLEITEALVMEDVEATIVKLQEIRALGLNIAIDSFGTGYSSLAYLTRLPVQMLKIDKSFIERMLDDRDAMTMVSTMISLAHALRLKVVAVGVDTEEQAKVLHLLTCDQMQGALAGPPMSADDLAKTL
jgi:diguanylate cyclase (GGDEF)-like protein